MYLDIIIAVPLLYGLIKGFSNGLIKEIIGLLSLIIGIYVAVNFSIFLEPYLVDVFDDYEQFKPIVAFAILFVAAILIIKLIGSLVNKLTKVLALGFISSIFGGVFGLLKIALIVSFLLAIEARFELIPAVTKKNTKLYKPTLKLLEIIVPHFEKHKGLIKDLQEETKEVTEEIETQANSQ